MMHNVIANTKSKIHPTETPIAIPILEELSDSDAVVNKNKRK